MQFPELNESNTIAINKLTAIKNDEIDLHDTFLKFAKNVDTKEDDKYFEATYLDFEDYDYLHDTSKHKQIYLNDFDFNIEEDRVRLKELLSSSFTGNTFKTIASCGCGELHGNYLVGSGVICDDCGDTVHKDITAGNNTNLWLRTPEGVKAFVNIGVYNTLLSGIKVSKVGPVCLPEYMMSSKYRAKINRDKPGSAQVVMQLLFELGIKEVSYNSFIENYDRIMTYLLIGDGLKQYTKLEPKAKAYYEIYTHTRDVVFHKYLRAPNRLNAVLERSGNQIYASKNQLSVVRLFIDIADSRKSNEFLKLQEKDFKFNASNVGNSLVELSVLLNTAVSSKSLFGKKRLARHHVSSGSIPFTGRAVITSETGISNPSELTIPWRMALTMCYYHITNALYRNGYTPRQVVEKINLAGYQPDTFIDELFKKVREDCLGIVNSGRNPSNEYLSYRTFLMVVNNNLDDEAIHIPINACGPFNSDFDGKQLPSLNFSNCWNPLKLV